MSIALSGAILTANRRADGVVVFLDVEGDWNADMRVAAVARASDERRALADRARYEAARHVVLAPRLLEVVETDGHMSLCRARPRPIGVDPLADPDPGPIGRAGPGADALQAATP
jgi:hypothetical protein